LSIRRREYDENTLISRAEEKLRDRMIINRVLDQQWMKIQNDFIDGYEGVSTPVVIATTRRVCAALFYSSQRKWQTKTDNHVNFAATFHADCHSATRHTHTGGRVCSRERARRKGLVASGSRTNNSLTQRLMMLLCNNI